MPQPSPAAQAQRKRFSSAILPPWARKTPRITEVLPLLYLHGLSTGDFVPALGQFLGSSAGLSAAVITRLTQQWQAEQRAFAARDLSGVDYVYLWADGIHVNIRLEEHKLCLLVMIGVRADGRKELIALADGYRESAESWADLLRDCAPPRDARSRARSRGRGAGVLGWAVTKITDGTGQLLAFYDYPAEQWVHLRTTNPIESTFATVRHRSKVTKGPGSRAAGWPWRSSSSSQHKTAGAPSTRPTSSPWSAPERRSSTESSSSDPAKSPSRKPPKRS